MPGTRLNFIWVRLVPEPALNGVRDYMNLKDIGMILLAVFLIIFGLTLLIPSLLFNGMNIILGLLALAAGVLLAADRFMTTPTRP